MYVKLAYVNNVAIYVRQSQDRTGEELGVTRQRQDALALAKLRGWRVAHTFTDNDISAAGKRTRPGFEAMLSAIEGGKLRAVIGWNLDRLTRNPRDRMRLIEACSRHRVTIALVRGAEIDPTTPTGRMVAGILGEVAEHEIAQKADRQRRAAEQAVAAGRPVGGRRPFGYLADRVTVCEPEAEALRRAYDGVLHGVPLGRIARDLNAEGLFTPQTRRKGEHRGTPSPWTAQTIRPTLLNPRYAGLRAVSVRPERGRPTWDIRGTAVWEPIVSEAVWRAAVALLTDPSRANPPRSGQALLTGVARCGVAECGVTVHRGANPQRQPIYRCTASLGHVGRRAEPVDEYVSAVAVERLSRLTADDLIGDRDAPAVAELHAEMISIRSQLDGLARLLTEGVLTEAGVRAESARLRARRAEIETELADTGRADILGPFVGAEDAQAVWDALGTDRQRAVIDLLMSVVLLPPGRGTRTFRPETVVIEWRTA